MEVEGVGPGLWEFSNDGEFFGLGRGSSPA